MDTRWKKSKALCGFLSFALGVSLLLTALLPVVGNLLSGNGRERLGNALKADFQETVVFRSYLSELMNNFIAMGAGGPIGNSYYSAYDYADSAYLAGVVEATVVQEAGGEAYISDFSYPRQPSEADRDLWKRDAEAWAKQFQEDQNILYYITVDSRLTYTNMEYRKGAIPTFPAQGYSFRLSFNGTRCEAEKDGKRLNLYGDGIYQEDGKHWALPGYSNYLMADGVSGVRVYLAVADSPRLYLKVNYSSGLSQQWNMNRYYRQYQTWQENRRQFFVVGGAMSAAGLLLLFIYYKLREEKKLADRVIAKGTGHIWFEFKVLLLLAALVFALLPLTEEMRYLVQEVSYTATYEETAYYQYPWFLSSYLHEILRRPWSFLPAFWSGWLFVNDLRYGDKPWRNGICGLLAAKGMKLSVQKRLLRRFGLLGLGVFLLGLEVIFFLILQTLRAYLPLWAIWNLFLLPLLLFIGIYLWNLRRQKQLALELGSLMEQITAIRCGDLTSHLSLPENSELYQASEELSDIQQGMARAVEEQTRSERMKVELVTNVSHDLKTPLTSIISYAELLKQEELEPPAGEYVDVLCRKAERLRTMVLDVFDISKAASGNLPVKLDELDLGKLLRQTMADMAQVIDSAPVTLRQTLPEEPVCITADGERLYRVFQNLLQNALTYALEGSRVYLSLEIQDGKAVVCIKNTSKTELPSGIDYTERFVRGDPSRTDGGSGLGLAIADTFTRSCGGELRVEPIADLFVVSVRFPLSDSGTKRSLEECSAMEEPEAPASHTE